MDTEKQKRGIKKKSLKMKDRGFHIGLLGKYREFRTHGHGEKENRNLIC